MTVHEELDPLVPDPDRVVEIWCGLFRITRDELMSRSRIRRVVACRAAIAHELHESGWFNINDLARLFDRNHSSVCYMLKTYGPGGRRVSAGASAAGG